MTSIQEATATQLSEYQKHKERIGRLYGRPNTEAPPVEKKSVETFPVNPEVQLIADLRAEVTKLKAEIVRLSTQPEAPPVDIYEEPRVPTIQAIKVMVCRYYGATLVEMISERRTAQFIKPRHVAIHLCRKLTPASYPTIGKEFGKRDHTTCINADRSIARKRQASADFDAEITALERKLTGGV